MRKSKHECGKEGCISSEYLREGGGGGGGGGGILDMNRELDQRIFTTPDGTSFSL